MPNVVGPAETNVTAPADPGSQPPQYISAGRGVTVPNPAYAQWEKQNAAYQQWLTRTQLGVANAGANPAPRPSNAKPATGGNHTQTINGYTYIVDGNGNIVSYVGPANAAPPTNPSLGLGSYGGGSGSGRGMTAYEAAQVKLDNQKIADAEAQQKADEQYRQAQALDAFNKNQQDFQTKHFYGSIAGPAYAAPAGAPNWWKMPEPDYVTNYYKNTPNAGPDPWSQPNPYSGYSGSLFSNPQQPGTQQTPPAGALAAPVAARQGQAVNGPTPGVTSGALPAFNPYAPQTGQNLLTPPPIAQATPRSMAMGGGSDATELAIVHGGEQLVEPETIGATKIPFPVKRQIPSLSSPQYNAGPQIPGYAEGKVPGPPGQPQVAVLKPGEGVIPGGNFSDDNPSPVANAGPDSMNPLIKQLLAAVNGIITSPEFQSAVYTKPPISGNGDDSQGGDSTPGSFATGLVPGLPAPSSFTTPTPPPITPQQQSGVIPGPRAINHVPYGPELTGLSGYGGLITPNGTPVVASEWQRQHLDPTSLANYDDYAGSIAGYNPADLKQLSDQMTGVLNENSPTIKAPIKFNLNIPVPGQGGG